jgi:hypothetical protein
MIRTVKNSHRSTRAVPAHTIFKAEASNGKIAGKMNRG